MTAKSVLTPVLGAAVLGAALLYAAPSGAQQAPAVNPLDTVPVM